MAIDMYKPTPEGSHVSSMMPPGTKKINKTFVPPGAQWYIGEFLPPGA